MSGCSESVGGDFNCSNNELTSLEGCPVVLPVEHEYQFNCSVGIKGDFQCIPNRLAESELFLYDYSVEQICEYYKNKHLSEDLKKDLIQSSGVDFKKNKKYVESKRLKDY